MLDFLIENLNKNYEKYVCIIENLKNSEYETLYVSKTSICFILKPSNIIMVAGVDGDIVNAVNAIKSVTSVIFTPDENAVLLINKRFNLKVVDCFQYGYFKYDVDNELCLVKKIEPTIENAEFISKNYTLSYSIEEIMSLLLDKFMLGGYIGDEICAFIGMHEERSVGLLEVFEKFRRKGIGEFMVKKAVNYFIDNGFTPFSHVRCDNLPSINMQNKLKAKKLEEKVYWLIK